MKTPVEWIKCNYGDNWLNIEWAAGDVIDAMQEYAEEYHQEKMRSELIKFLNARDHDVSLSTKGNIEAVDEYLNQK